MTTHTYAGHTLAEIKAAAEAATPTAFITYKGHLLHAADPRVKEHSDPTPLFDGFTPTAVLAMAARIEELDRIERVAGNATVQNWLALPDEDKAKWFATSVKMDNERCQHIAELEQKLAKAITEHTDAFRLVAEVRHACGDDGKRELPELVQYVAGLRQDAERMDSGEIMTHDRDDFGEEYQCHRRGINLRAAIDAALEQTKNLEGA